MPSITIHTTPLTSQRTANPLPNLLHTPLGLAMIEIQGTLNIPLAPPASLPPPSDTDTDHDHNNHTGMDDNTDTETERSAGNGTRTRKRNSRFQPIGRLHFPLLEPDQNEDASGGGGGNAGATEGPWTKKVYLYVGDGQRLVGEVRRLPKVLGVLRRRIASSGGGGGSGDDDGQGDSEMGGMDGMDEHRVMEKGEERGSREELEIAELVRWKIVFAARPEFV